VSDPSSYLSTVPEPATCVLATLIIGCAGHRRR
jgi:hypothetical protein